MRATLAATLVASLCTGGPQATGYRPDDPIREDPDRILSIPQPATRSLSKFLDLLEKSFRPPRGGTVEAANINTIGEVPDSSWFTNRMSAGTLSNNELARGPDLGDGPDLSAPWRVVAAKTEGVTPGMRIRDARGDVYFIKFDPAQWLQMATSAEVVGTKFFWAFGYHVPENYLVHWLPEYEIDPNARIEWDDGHRDRMSRAFVRKILESVPRRPDGSIQVLASKRLAGAPLGPFDYQGTRRDDPNDIYPHQDRRELRALRIFTAWLNHNDSDAVNTLDMFRGGGEGGGHVVHYLIDFGTVLGSGATLPHARRVGNEYYLELAPSLKAAASFGLIDRPWRRIRYEMYPAVGRFESAYFDPATWKPDYPNPAHDKMTLQDALWAVRIVARFSDDAIRAIVATGRYDDPDAERHIVDRLIERRDKIVRYWAGRINPIDDFHVVVDEGDGARLDFTNIGVDAGLATDCRYGYAWHTYGNGTGVVQAIGRPGIASLPSIRVPPDHSPFLMVKLSTSGCVGGPRWNSEVRVFLRNADNIEVVGIERDDPPPGEAP